MYHKGDKENLRNTASKVAFWRVSRNPTNYCPKSMKFGHHSVHPSLSFAEEQSIHEHESAAAGAPPSQRWAAYIHTYIIPTFFNPILVFFDTFGVVNSGRFLVAPRATQKYQIRLHKKRTFWIIPNRNFCSLKLSVIFRPFS